MQANPNSKTTTTVLPASAWHMILGGVTVRKYLRNLRCFVRGHNAVHVPTAFTSAAIVTK